MITKPTVYVLGAGVSAPYGFPSGGLLVEQICSATAGTYYEDDRTALIDKGEIHDLIVSKFGEVNTEKFGTALFNSQKQSIDSFLEHRPEFMEIGKFAIALFILRNEKSENLREFQYRQKGCYQYLYNALDSKWEKFAENQVAFITFNYDRSFEHFLFTSLQNTHGKSDSECAEILSRLSIIHVHGSLGMLPWQSENGIAYGASFRENRDNKRFISSVGLSASEQIKVITENTAQTPEFQSSYKLLCEANRIYFLGFGYHPTNLERLGIKSLPAMFLNRAAQIIEMRIDQSPMMGSAKNLEDAERRRVKENWLIQLPDSSSDSLDFLRKYAELD